MAGGNRIHDQGLMRWTQSVGLVRWRWFGMWDMTWALTSSVRIPVALCRSTKPESLLKNSEECGDFMNRGLTDCWGPVQYRRSSRSVDRADLHLFQESGLNESSCAVDVDVGLDPLQDLFGWRLKIDAGEVRLCRLQPSAPVDLVTVAFRVVEVDPNRIPVTDFHIEWHITFLQTVVKSNNVIKRIATPSNLLDHERVTR